MTMLCYQTNSLFLYHFLTLNTVEHRNLVDISFVQFSNNSLIVSSKHFALVLLHPICNRLFKNSRSFCRAICKFYYFTDVVKYHQPIRNTVVIT